VPSLTTAVAIATTGPEEQQIFTGHQHGSAEGEAKPGEVQ